VSSRDPLDRTVMRGARKLLHIHIHVHATVDADDLAGDEARVVTAEEGGGGGDVVWGAARTGTMVARMSRNGTVPTLTPAWAIGVSTIEGGMVLTVMPCGDSSYASALVSAMTSPLDAT
jgi:hypothetical protein